MNVRILEKDFKTEKSSRYEMIVEELFFLYKVFGVCAAKLIY